MIGGAGPDDGPQDPTPGRVHASSARHAVDAPRLDLLKALGDNTRYAIYLELARSPAPLTTAEIAGVLGLHVNTVRPHLERMRDVGLLAVQSEQRGVVGRPHHRYSLAEGAPTLGLEPSSFPLLARVLLQAASAGGLDPDDLGQAGRGEGRAQASAWGHGADPVDALIGEQARLGFDPEVIDLDGGAVMAFAHCPFRELAEAHPDLVCRLHRGLVEGLLEGVGHARIVAFHPLIDRTPCQVEVAIT